MISSIYILYQSTFATPHCQLILEKICDNCNNFPGDLYNPSHRPLILLGGKKISNQKTYQLNNHHNCHRASITLHHLLSQSINVTTYLSSSTYRHHLPIATWNHCMKQSKYTTIKLPSNLTSNPSHHQIWLASKTTNQNTISIKPPPIETNFSLNHYDLVVTVTTIHFSPSYLSDLTLTISGPYQTHEVRIFSLSQL